MSVYYKEKPSNLLEAFRSVWNQTLPTNDFVLVCDGALGEELNSVIEDQLVSHGDCLNVLRLDKQEGLGKALSMGILACKNEFIMRADSDDVSAPNRAEAEMSFMIDKELDICSSRIIQFSDDIHNFVGERALPLSHNEIVKYSKIRCPFNHPATMFKKSVVLNAGNYQTLLFVEDWFLWVRILQQGAQCGNLPSGLVFMRTNSETLARRKNKTKYKSALKLFKYMKTTKYVGLFNYLRLRIVYFIQYISPSFFARIVYSGLHKRSKNITAHQQ